MDETLLLLINGCHNDYWDEVMWMLTYRFTWIPLYIAIAIAVMRTVGWRRGLFFLVSVALTILLADQVCSHVIRPWAERLRPSNAENPLSAMIHLVHDYRGGAYGMPSCHAANTVGLLTIMCWQFRHRALLALLTVWMLAQIYSRMYLGVHYPTDLLVGAVVGAVCGCVMSWTYRKSVERWLGEDFGVVAIGTREAAVPITVLFITMAVIMIMSV